MRVCCFCAAAVVAVVSAAAGAAEVYRTSPEEDWFALLSGAELQPGDEVVLGGGVYSDPRRLSISHRGTAERPVVIRAAEGERVVFRRPDAKKNTMNLEGVEHLHLKDFEITGGAAGIRISPAGGVQPTGVVLQGLHLHHLGGVAVTCNHRGGIYSRMLFRDNHIHHTSGHGEAFYLGGNHASAIFRDSRVVGNYIHDLRGPDVSQGDGIEIKQGGYGNVIAGNVIHDTSYPGIIVYGTGGKPRNRIANNVIWNTSSQGIQAAADAVIAGNFVAGAGGAAIYSRNHQEAVAGNLVIRDNVLIAHGGAPAIRLIRPSQGDGGEYSGPVEVTGNVILAGDGSAAIRAGDSELLMFQNNHGTGRVEGVEVQLEPITQPDSVPELPELPGHPAWEFLDRQEVAPRFQGS